VSHEDLRRAQATVVAADAPLLTGERLTIPVDPFFRYRSAFVGFLFGFLGAMPIQLVYAALRIVHPDWPGGTPVLFATYAGPAAIGAVIAYLRAQRWEGISIEFDSDQLSMYRDGILLQQFRWRDVERIEFEWGYRIYLSSGETVNVSRELLHRETYEIRSLRNQLRRYVQRKPPDLRRFVIGGAISAAIGGLMIAAFGTPRDVMDSGDLSTGLSWLRLIPSIVGLTALGSGFMLALVGCLSFAERKKTHPFQISELSLRKGSRELLWSDITRVQRSGRQDKYLRLEAGKRPVWEIDCSLYSDGDALRDAILALVPKREAPAPSLAGTGELVGNALKGNLGAVIFLGGFAAVTFVVALGSFAFHWFAKPGQDDSVPLGCMFLVYGLLLGSVTLLVCYTVRLTQDEVVQKWLIGPTRTIRLDEIERVELRASRKRSGREFMTLSGRGRKVQFGSFFWEYGEMRDRILSRVPPTIVRRS